MHHLAQNAPIAIIGMAGEFPGASDVEGLWDLLVKGLNTVSEVPSTIFVPVSLKFTVHPLGASRKIQRFVRALNRRRFPRHRCAVRQFP